MNYRVAIPSYRREQTLISKTLAMLERQGIESWRITVFVANSEEADRYQAALEAADKVIPVVVAVPGIRGARNFIQEFYPAGTRLLSVDDDVASVYRKHGEQGKEEIVDLDRWVLEVFRAMTDNGISLAGVHPVNNPFFLKHSVTMDLRFIIGTLNLTLTSPEPWARLTVDEKEDFEQTLIRFVRDGGVLRWNGVGLETKGRTEPGGLQELGAQERKARNEAAAQLLAQRYPDLAQVWHRKNGLPELRLKTPRTR